MARKKGKEMDTRAALLDAGWKLLPEQGGAAMSIDAIAASAGLSKGTFFHFFHSKLDYLDNLCERIAEESWREVGGWLERTDVDPVVRLSSFLVAERSWRFERSPAFVSLWRQLVRPENAVLMARVRAHAADRLAPALARLIAEGDALGTFRVGDPEIAARLLVEWMVTTVEGNARLLFEKPGAEAVGRAVRRSNAMLEAVERILGAPEGCLGRLRPEDVARIAAAVPDATGRRAMRGGTP